MSVAWLCDFDGTVSPRDIGAAFAKRFSPDGAAARVPELADWFAGRCGHRVVTRAQCAVVRAEREEALAFVRGFTLDPAFAPFAREAMDRGEVVMVVSEGFDFYVRELLEREGLGALPWAANHLRFEADGRVTPEFPFADPACDDCGNCKAGHVRRFQALGHRVLLVGDGGSDRHGALAADGVLARGHLREWCRDTRLPHVPIDDFRDVAAFARRPVTHPSAPSRRAAL
ncbi:MAG TPA: HAD-IB family phosphatase [Methylomirabilota bacterium]|jgi:2-hydroxy-3-keto-5-methylthiopentenyl-1-phosphate phosphatase|nr:HAD-IB family phosphatase [Methylomirabilota bacterium]